MIGPIPQVNNNINIQGEKLSIVNIFGKENLENIQQKISKATGIAFVTVDYRGIPVTEMTSFSNFCKAVRRDEKAMGICMTSDALGGIQAAITQKPYVYFCPCGLLEVAIPIVIQGNYLGGFIGGQMQCFDAPADTIDLRNVLSHEKDYRENSSINKLFNEVSVMSYEQFLSFADLIYLIINQLAEKEMSKLQEKEYLNKEIEALKDKRKAIELQNNLKNTELVALRSKMNPYFLLRCLNIISNMAILEEALKTNEVISMISDFFKFNFLESRNMVTLHEEIDNIEKYLKIQKVRLGDIFTYSINIQKKIFNVPIPSLIVLPFVEKAMFFSILQKEKNVLLEINVSESGNYINIDIFDNGTEQNFSDSNKSLEKYKIYNGDYEDVTIEDGIVLSKQRFVKYYGNDFKIQSFSVDGLGHRTMITFPKKSDERIV